MSDLAKIKEVQRITSAGIVACKSALQLADGDLFEAVASLLSHDDAKLMRSELLSRQCASGDRLSEEQAFVDRLIERLEPERELIESAAEWRPGTVYQDGLWMRFCDSFTFAYLSDPNVGLRFLSTELQLVGSQFTQGNSLCLFPRLMRFAWMAY